MAEPSSSRKPIWKRFSMPIIFKLLKSPRLLTGLLLSFVQATLMGAFDSVLTVYTKSLFGFNSLSAGLIFLALVVPTIVSPAVGWYCDKHGPRLPAFIGLALPCPFLVLLRLVNRDTSRDIVLLCVFLALIGLGLAITLPPAMSEISAVVTDAEKKNPGCFGKHGAYAQAYGLFNFSFAAGYVVGPVWGGIMNEKVGWDSMSWSLGLFCGVCAVPTLVYVGGKLDLQKLKRRTAVEAETTE